MKLKIVELSEDILLTNLANENEILENMNAGEVYVLFEFHAFKASLRLIDFVFTNYTNLNYRIGGSDGFQNLESFCKDEQLFNDNAVVSAESMGFSQSEYDMSLIPGKTLAYVSDKNLLCCTENMMKLYVQLRRDIIEEVEYINAYEFAEKYGKTAVAVKKMCRLNRIPGAKKERNLWIIPANAVWPEDRRTVGFNEISEDLTDML